jgi:hypothetical protein
MLLPRAAFRDVGLANLHQPIRSDVKLRFGGGAPENRYRRPLIFLKDC